MRQKQQQPQHPANPQIKSTKTEIMNGGSTYKNLNKKNQTKAKQKDTNTNTNTNKTSKRKKREVIISHYIFGKV